MAKKNQLVIIIQANEDNKIEELRFLKLMNNKNLLLNLKTAERRFFYDLKLVLIFIINRELVSKNSWFKNVDNFYCRNIRSIVFLNN